MKPVIYSCHVIYATVHNSGDNIAFADEISEVDNDHQLLMLMSYSKLFQKYPQSVFQTKDVAWIREIYFNVLMYFTTLNPLSSATREGGWP